MGNLHQVNNREFLNELKCREDSYSKCLLEFIQNNVVANDFFNKNLELEEIKNHLNIFEILLQKLCLLLYERSRHFEEIDSFVVNKCLEFVNKIISKFYLINKKITQNLLWTNLEDKIINSETEVILIKKDFSIFLRLLISIKNLFFINNFCVDYKKENLDKKSKEIEYYGWFNSKTNEKILTNRISLLELLLLLYYIELDYMMEKNKQVNSVLFFFKSIDQNDLFFASLLKQATSYEENGFFPYSAYFYQTFLQKEMYSTALSLNLSILFLKETSEEDDGVLNPHLNTITEYLNDNQKINDDFLLSFFRDSDFLLEIINKITKEIMTIYLNQLTIFPKSLKITPFIEEMVFLLLTFINIDEKVIEVIVRMKKDINLIMPLLILIDQIEKNLDNGLYYLTLSCILKLSSSDVFCQRLNEENKFDYKFKEMSIISGDVIDYIICFFIKMIDIKVKENDFDSIFIFLSILNNVSLYAIDLKKSTCKEIFGLICKLENYNNIVANLNILNVLFNLFVFLEKIIVYNWKSNTLLGAYFILHQEKFERITNFGENKNKLAILLFDKVQKKIYDCQSKNKSFKIKLSENKENFLMEIYDNIQNIKGRYNFTNLENYLKSTNKNLHILNNDERSNINKIKKFLDLYCLSNFFRQTSNITNRNFLNNKDLIYIKRFEKINALNIANKIVKEDMQKIITSIFDN